jgi:uncharacterized protein YehS (DUF1456 family)
MTAVNHLREQLAEEIRQIPDTKLSEVLDVIHYFRVGVESTRQREHPNKSHNDRSELLKKIRQCIRKPNKAPLGDFSLSLDGYKFDRDEANER